MRRLALCLSVLLSPALASAQAPRDPTRLFPREASVTAPRPGLTRLPITAEVLAAVRGDLSDVRLYDADDREVPFLVDSGARRAPEVRRFALEPREIERRVEPRPAGGPTYVERIEVRVPPDEGNRRLVVGSGRWRFVREAVIVDLESGRELFRGSLFSLPSPRRQRLTVPLPPAGQGPLALSIELRGEDAYLDPTLDVVVDRQPLEVPTLTVPLEEVRREPRSGATWIELTRPSGLVPDRLRVATSTRAFSREVRVVDLAQGGVHGVVGEAVVWRLAELDGASELEVPLRASGGARLRVEIDDLDSPPLEELRVEAEVRQPGLLFASDGRPHTLRYGGGRARAPRYDLADLSRRVIGLVHSVTLPEAALGASRASPRFDDGPALRFAMRPGRAVDASAFTHVARLEIAGAREGLSRVNLPLSVLAPARPDAGDLRVVDDGGRQRAYLWGAEESHPVPVTLGAPEASEGSSTVRVELPASFVRVRALHLATPAEYVARSFVLRGIDGSGRWVELARGSLRRDPPEIAPLVIEVTPTRVSSLSLEIVDGDDAPLSFDEATLVAARRPLFLAAPDGEYRVLVGQPALEAPTYEIERARGLVLAVRAVGRDAGEASPNPERVEPPWHEAVSWSTWGVWGVLLLAILLLGGLTVRVARQAPPPTPSEGAEEGPTPTAEDRTAADSAGAEPDEGETEPIAF